jgi:CRP/FNR family transcriptional regulator
MPIAAKPWITRAHGSVVSAPPWAAPRVARRIRVVPLGPRPEEGISLAADLDAETVRQVGKLVAIRTRLRKGQTLFRAGDGLASLYWIRSGSFKTVTVSESGCERVSGYHMPGDIIGSDAIGTARHACKAMALEDSEVCSLPFEGIEALCMLNRHLQRNLHRLLSREVARANAVIALVTTLRAEQRLAAYLLELSRRYRERGYSSREFVLRMTRAEIGSYLGLELETISRSFSRLQRDGMLWVRQRDVKLLDLSSLKRFVGSC